MRKLDYDPVTGITTWHDYDEASDTTTIHQSGDVGPILEANKIAQTMGKEFTRGKDVWHAARIPNLIIEKWLNEDGVDVFNRDHWPAVMRKLNSSEYRYLRTDLCRL